MLTFAKCSSIIIERVNPNIFYCTQSSFFATIDGQMQNQSIDH